MAALLTASLSATGQFLMHVWLFMAAVALSPRNEAIEDRVDAIEVNHLYDAQGSPILDQLIFWEWRPQEGAFRVAAWKLLKCTSQRPRQTADGGGVECAWWEGVRLRKVRAPSMRETWTQYDPEVYDRQFLPKHARRGLNGDFDLGAGSDTQSRDAP